MRILHVADVHLDRPFVGLERTSASARRQELRDAFDRCLTLACESEADLLTIGGDLWEDEHVTPDTLRWVAARLRAIEIPCVLVSGNHDPLYPGGPYERAGFPETVTILAGAGALDEVKLGDVSVWGTSWRKSVPLTADFLSGFMAPDDGRRHVLLLHGTCGFYFDESAHCPFTGKQVREAGFDLCLAGHIHAGNMIDDCVVYPGSPEPLGWSETGTHAMSLVTIDDAGVNVELIPANTRRYEHRAAECDGAGSSAEVESRVRTLLEDVDMVGLCLRLDLTGRVSPDCEVETAAIHNVVAGLGATMIQVLDHTALDFDLDAIAAGTGVQAHFVRRMRDLQNESPGDETVAYALRLGLQALHGDLL